MNRVARAILQEKINKYYPGSPKFMIKSEIPFSQDFSAPVPNGRSANKSRAFQTNKIEMKAAINLEVPKCITVDYKEKFIPAGTEFWIAFTDESDIPVVLRMV